MLRSGGASAPVVDEGPAATAAPAPWPPAPVGIPVFSTEVRVGTFGGFTWAWDDSEIWRYSAGAWSLYATAPDLGGDLAYASDTLWALNDSGLQYLEAGIWRQLNAPILSGAWRIAPEPGTGMVWVSTGEDLYRWDGTDMTNVGHPSNWEADGEVGDGFVGDIAVASDGTIWAAGLHGYVPWLGGLARYHDDTGSWEAIRPLGGDRDVSASLLAPTPGGDLWVMLADWFEDWEEREAAGEPTAVLALARYDGATGEWSVYDEDLPDGYPQAMASGGDSVWFARRSGSVAGFNEIGGVLRFDGQTWTTYLEGTSVTGIAVAPDGTIWYTIDGALYRLEP